MSKQISCRFVRLFQSTPSSRRATFWKVTATTTPAHFNPRPPHGGRQDQYRLFLHVPLISIHALLTEGDRLIDRFRESVDRFQSTPSSRRATQPIRHITTLQIHFNPRPPHGGRQRVLYHFSAKGHFNPRPPHGGRRKLTGMLTMGTDFNPRPPHGGRPC